VETKKDSCLTKDIEIIQGDSVDNGWKIGIVVTQWNSLVTDKLLQGAWNVLRNKGFAEQQLIVVRCPGAFEIPFTSRALLPKVDGVITLGTVIRGETAHFDYICKAVTEGVLQLNMEGDKPVVFGVLTTDTVQQATERADEKSDFGNKGAETALAIIDMISLRQKIDKIGVHDV
jgi:6,7-dimethyl-8-ribityllumazine synthase